jgi:ankyrin repeat protein
MINKLFEYLKNHEYDSLITTLKSDDSIDLNEPDETGLYLIHYAILFRQKDIVALLISKKCKLDVLDADGYSIFYQPIKMNYIEIVRILIYFNNIVVGIPLLELQDKYLNIPLNYAIKFKKIDCIDEILDNKINLNYKDSDGNTVLHQIISIIDDTNIHLINKMIKNRISINLVNKFGQNALHIAIENKNINVCRLLLLHNIDINVGTIEFQLTPLLLSVILDEYEICKLLLEYNVDINQQDSNGNSVLHHSIDKHSIKFIELFSKVDNNLVNINGNIALHLFFDNNYNMKELDTYRFREILIKSKLNIQNNQGKTLIYYLVENDIWENYMDILINRNMNIFIQDINNITPSDIIDNKFNSKKDKFINMIAESYINTSLIDSNKYYINNDHLKKYILNKDQTVDKKKDCIRLLYQHIINDKLTYQNKHVYCLDVIHLANVELTTYLGISIDILSGMLYLQQKFKNVCTSLTSNLIDNPNLISYYKSNGLKKGLYGDFLNFEIVWSFQKFFYPTTLKKSLDKFMLDDSYRYFIIPIGIELTHAAHANIILFDKQMMTIERYEPYGKDWPPGFNYNPDKLDLNLENLFKNLLENTIEIKYYAPKVYEQKIGLQIIDINEHNISKNIGDPGGFCAGWSLWYVEMRIINENIGIFELIPKLIHNIRTKRIYFRTIIRSYTKHITDVRDKILNTANLDINKWFNDNYTIEEWDNVNKIIQKLIK